MRTNIIIKLQLSLSLAILITGCASIYTTPDIPVTLSTTHIIGVEGGKVEDPSGVKIIIPPRALSNPVNIQIGVYKTPPKEAKALGKLYFIGPSGIKLNKPAIVTVPFNPDTLLEGVELSDVRLLRYDDNNKTWSALESSIDLDKNTITGQTSKFSGFAPGILEELPLAILSFAADNRVVIAGERTELSWSIVGATSLSIDNGVGDVTGQNSVSVLTTQTTTYILTAKNPSIIAKASLKIDVVDPVPMSRLQITNHMGVTSSYLSYQEIGSKYRIVCEEPCGIDEKLIYSRYWGFKPAKEQLINLMGVDILDEFSPFDIHMESDTFCGDYDPVWAGFSGRYTQDVEPTNGSGGSYGCFFDIDKGDILPENSLKINNQILYVHEYAHIVFFGRHRFSYEDVVKAASFYISRVPPTTNACDPIMNFKWQGKLIYELCQQNGFSFEDLAPTLQKLDSLYKSGKGYNGGRTSGYQYREILNQHLGSDTLNAFLDTGFPLPANVGDSATLGLDGGNYSLIRDHISLSVPPLAILGKTPIKIEALEGVPPRSGFNRNMAYDIMPKDQIYSEAIHRHPIPPSQVNYSTFLKPVQITIRYDPSLLDQGIDERSLRLFRIKKITKGNNIVSTWEKVPDSFVDIKLKQVTAYINDLGVYAIMPEVLPQIQIIKPGKNDVFVDGETIELEAIVQQESDIIQDPLVIWSEGEPYPQGRIIGRGKISLTRLAPGVYDIYATYLGSEVVSDHRIITITVPHTL